MFPAERERDADEILHQKHDRLNHNHYVCLPIDRKKDIKNPSNLASRFSFDLHLVSFARRKYRNNLSRWPIIRRGEENWTLAQLLRHFTADNVDISTTFFPMKNFSHRRNNPEEKHGAIFILMAQLK